MRGCKAFVALVGMMGIMAASSISAGAAPVIETNPIKFVQYKCTNMNVNLLFPENWTFMEEDSNDDNYLFFGPGDYSYVELSRLKFTEDGDIIPINYFAQSVYDQNVENGLNPLAEPAVIQFGDEFGMISGYVASEPNGGRQSVYLDVMCIQEDAIVILSIGDELYSFLENVNDYNVIISSFTNNPADAGMIQKYVSDAFPAAGVVPESLIQGYMQWRSQSGLGMGINPLTLGEGEIQ